jgi:hypothetical protein
LIQDCEVFASASAVRWLPIDAQLRTAVGPLIQQEKDPDRPFADKKRGSDTQLRVKSVFHFLPLSNYLLNAWHRVREGTAISACLPGVYDRRNH